MIRRLGERLPAGLLGAGAIVGCTVIAHAAAGGSVTGQATIGRLAAAVLLLGALLACVRWRFGALLAIAAAAQPMLHVALGSSGSHSVGSGAEHAIHHHAGEQAEMVVSSGHAGTTMWIVHVLAGVVTAVVVRWGWRWLRSMPALLRAIAYAICSVRLTVAEVVTSRDLAGTSVPNQLSLLTWDERGPPHPV